MMYQTASTAFGSDITISKIFWDNIANHFKIKKYPKKPKKISKNKSKNDTLNNSSPLRTKTLQSTYDANINDDEAEFQHNLMLVKLEEIDTWSPNNRRLYELFMEKGFDPDVVNKQFITEYYTELKFNNQKIAKIDVDVVKFANLEILNLNNNRIQVLENISQNIKEIYAYYNQLSLVNLNSTASYQNLIFLGLAYNSISDGFLDTFNVNFPNLLSLDLAFNELCIIDKTIENILPLQHLRMLNLFGNPITLLPNYKTLLLDDLKHLKILDNEKVPNSYQESITEKGQLIRPGSNPTLKKGNTRPESRENVIKNTISPRRPGSAKSLNSPKKILNNDDSQGALEGLEAIPEEVSVKLNMSFLTLENIEGVNFNPDYNSAGAKPADIWQTCYWLSFKALDTQYDCKSSKFLYENCTIENDKARLSFDYIIDIKLPIDIQARNQFREGLVITIWKSEPKIIEPNPNDPPSKDPVERKPFLKADGNPEVIESILGVFKIELKEFLELKIGQKPLQNFRYRIFPPEVVNYFEFVFPLKDEANILKKFGENVPSEEKKDDDKKGGKGQPQGKDAKKDVKKDTKKAAKKGGKDEVEKEKKIIPLYDLPIHHRQKVYIQKDDKVIDSSKLLITTKVELIV